MLRTLKVGAAVASSGNAGGAGLQTTVFPFILRGVALLGMDSVNMPIARRRELWDRLATDLRPRDLGVHCTEVTLDTLDEALDGDRRRRRPRPLDRPDRGVGRGPGVRRARRGAAAARARAAAGPSSAGYSGNGVAATASSIVRLAVMDAAGQLGQGGERDRLRVREPRPPWSP